jgi:hypothetical protein
VPKFGARSGRHDDLVLAVAIALWRAHGADIPGMGIFEYYRNQATKADADVTPGTPPATFGFALIPSQKAV